LRFSVLGIHPRLEDLEAIIQAEDLFSRCPSTRNAVLPSDIPVDFSVWSHSIKSAFSSTLVRRPSGAIGNSFKVTASKTAKMADQAFCQLIN
jgi:hypothetical protein